VQRLVFRRQFFLTKCFVQTVQIEMSRHILRINGERFLELLDRPIVECARLVLPILATSP
jgi:hypothetical protein